MAVTTELADTSANVEPAAESGSAITPAALLRALGRPQVASGRLAFEARMVERARGRCLRADAAQRTFDLIVASPDRRPDRTPDAWSSPIAVGLSSRGPVVFRQIRIGRYGEPFECLKFRTMRIDAEERLAAILLEDAEGRAAFEKDFKLPVDPRITHVGRILRRTSLDELPQLFNVLRGEMSLVGPRPVVPEELGQIRQLRPGGAPGAAGHDRRLAGHRPQHDPLPATHRPRRRSMR